MRADFAKGGARVCTMQDGEDLGRLGGLDSSGMGDVQGMCRLGGRAVRPSLVGSKGFCVCETILGRCWVRLSGLPRALAPGRAIWPHSEGHKYPLAVSM